MENPNRKQMIYLIVLILILIVLSVFFLFRSSQRKTGQTQNIPLNKISDIRALGPVLTPDGQNIYYYDLTDLNLYKFDIAAQQKTPLSKNLKDKPLDLYWSPNRENVILKIESNNGLTALWNYNLQAQELDQLPQGIFNPASEATLNPIWTADSEKIIYYLAPTSGNPALYMADPDGANAQFLGHGPEKTKFYSILSYNQKDKILFYDSYSTETNLYDIYKLDLNSGENTQLFLGFQTAMAINDKELVISDDANSYLYDLDTQEQKKLPVLAQDQKTGISIDNTKLVTIVNDQGDEKFYIINLADQSIVKSVYDKNQTGSSYGGINLDQNNNLYFTNNYQLYEIRN